MRKRRPPAPIYLVSSAGVPNYGDEFITRAWLDWLARRHPGVPVWLDCLEPGRAAHLFGDAHPLLRTTNTLWHLADMGRGRSLAEGAHFAADTVENFGSPRFDLGLMDLRSVRSVHLLGGGYLNSVWEHQLLLLPALTQLKRAHGIPIYATGQGISPLGTEAREALPEWVSAFDVFETRDAPSASMLGAQCGVDDAFLALANRRPIYSREPTPDLMVLVQGDFMEAEKQDALVAAVVEFVRGKAIGAPVGVIESLPPDDSWILPRLAAAGIQTEFFPFIRLWQDGFPARVGQSWLSTRFHFHLLAAAAGARGTVFDLHEDYYGVKHKSLLEIGTGWSYASDPSQLAVSTPTIEQGFVRKASALSGQKVAVAKKIYG